MQKSFFILALALGLASTRATQIPIETLLIDEGFGALDSSTLDHALAELSAGNRDELRELLLTVDRHDFWGLLQAADPSGLGSEAEVAPFPAVPNTRFNWLIILRYRPTGRPSPLGGTVTFGRFPLRAARPGN